MKPRRKEPPFRVFAFDGLRGVPRCGSFGVADDRIGRLAAGSVLVLADGTRFTPVEGDVVGQSTGDLIFRRRRTVQIIDTADVIGIPEAVSLRQDVVVELTDLDDRVPQGTRVLIPAGTLATVLLAAEGSTGVVAPGAGTAPAGQGNGPTPPPVDAWWTREQQESGSPCWLKWGLVVIGVTTAGWALWSMTREVRKGKG